MLPSKSTDWKRSTAWLRACPSKDDNQAAAAVDDQAHYRLIGDQ